MSPHPIALLIFACACGTSPKETTSSETATDSAQPWPDTDTGDAVWIVPDTAPTEAPPIDPAAIAAQIEAALEAGVGVTAAPLLPAIDASLANAEPGCPDWYTDADGNPYWADTCTTSGGTTYAGYALISSVDGLVDAGVTWSGFALAMSGRVDLADGDTLEMDGYATFLQGVEETGSLTLYSALDRGPRWTASSAPWLAAGDGPALSIYAVGAPDGSGGAASISMRHEPEDSFTAVLFEELLFITESWGSGCPMEPNGAISVLAADGRWLELEFDGPSWGAPVDPALCDGCGRAYSEGRLMGDVCVDFSTLSDLSNWPLWTGPYR